MRCIWAAVCVFDRYVAVLVVRFNFLYLFDNELLLFVK